MYICIGNPGHLEEPAALAAAPLPRRGGAPRNLFVSLVLVL